MTDSNYITLYDSTLRDGAQARGVDFSATDKTAIAEALDAFGIDYVEGGWPGANSVDDAFFADLPVMSHATITAFGMTRRAGHSAENDPGLAALLNSDAKSICLVGKSWDFQVTEALELSPDENLAMIRDSIALIVAKGKEAMFDAEHFFDGYKARKEYALSCIKAAHDAGARWIILCDTNGGTLPEDIERIVHEVTEHIPGEQLGIHCHNDTGNAVANSLAAVRAGVRQIQGTINGVGERCGNADLVSIIPSLMLKMGYKTGVSSDNLTGLTRLSRLLDDRLNRAPDVHAPYVGAAAFAHKGGLHVSAMARNSATYEHIPPEKVGNQRSILVSDKAGRSNVLARLKELDIQNITPDDKRIDKLVEVLKAREADGYAYDSADASFEMLVRRTLKPHAIPDYFELLSYRVIDERRYDANRDLITMAEATIKIRLGSEVIMTVAEGNGPVNALDQAMRRALVQAYPEVRDMVLTDYKVRILTPEDATGAITRVTIESHDSDGKSWTTIGVSGNVIDASFKALQESIAYKLYSSGQRAKVIV